MVTVTNLLSIIIPTYNMEALLDKCLTSLILDTQEYRSMLDVIVVIDGATDRSSEIAHKYADQYSETFSVIDKENGNYGSCINAALPHVKGKYVRILDADDSYETKNLKEYLDLLSRINVDMVLTDFATYDPDDKLMSESSFPFSANKEFSFGEIPSDTFLAMHAVAYRSSIFNEIDYHQTEGVSYTDMEWVFHPMSKVSTVFYYNKQIYRYLVGREGQTVDDNVRLKRLSHVEQGLWTQLKVFDNIDKTVYSYEYLQHMIDKRTKHIYLSGMNKKANFNLVAFDNKLRKEFPNTYNKAETYSIEANFFGYKMPIVRMWRKTQSKKGMLLYPSYWLHLFGGVINKIIP